MAIGSWLGYKQFPTLIFCFQAQLQKSNENQLFSAHIWESPWRPQGSVPMYKILGWSLKINMLLYFKTEFISSNQLYPKKIITLNTAQWLKVRICFRDIAIASIIALRNENTNIKIPFTKCRVLSVHQLLFYNVKDEVICMHVRV